MKIKYLIKYLCICTLICITPEFSLAAVRHENIQFSDGKLSVNLRQALFKDVVKTISEKSGTNIYIFDDLDNLYITTEFSDRSLESGLRSILKEVDYAVVYQSGPGNGVVRWMNDSDKRKKSGYRRSGSNRESLASVRENNSSANSMRKNNIENSNSRDIDQAEPVNNSDSDSTAAPVKYGVNDSDASESSDNTDTMNNTCSTSGGDSAQSTGDGDEGVSESSASSDDEDTGDLSADSSDIAESSNDERAETGDAQEYVSSQYDDIPSWYYEGMSKAEGKLRYRIDELEKQIESGSAESEYQLRVSKRGENASVSPEEELDIYYDRLEELSGI